MEERSLAERARATATEQIGELQREVEQFRRLLHETSKERDDLVEQRNARQLQYESEVIKTDFFNDVIHFKQLLRSLFGI